jgi:NitT/TauT family transport system substrate-binding protein
MDDEQLAYSHARMLEYGIVDSGDALKLGIGAMSDARWREFSDTMVKAGVYPADIDVSKAYTLQFVNKGHGMNLKRPN